MNAVFEPSLLFISDESWLDEEQQDAFLEHLMSHLNTIDKYDLTRIWWTEELQRVLVEMPQMHPWYGSDLRNPIISILHHQFYSRTEDFVEDAFPCKMAPALVSNYSNTTVLEHFLKLIHALVDYEEDFYLCVGLANRLLNGNYSFSCDCHDKTPKHFLLNQGKDWLQYIDVAAQFFPSTIEEFDDKFELGMEIVRLRDFEGKPYLFDFEFTKKIKKSIVKEKKYQIEIFEAVVRKLILTPEEAGKSDLKDEFLKRSKEYRFRVTQRPSSTRIHYDLGDENQLIFLEYYGEGEHDDGL